MARRKYPFYKPVGHRTADKVRGGIASWLYGWIQSLWGIFILWIGFFLFLKLVEFMTVYNGGVVEDPVQFGAYVSGTYEHILQPMFSFIAAFVSTVLASA